jgi:type I restriction enzyme, S subunit
MTIWTTSPLTDVVEFFDSRRVPLSGIERANRQGPYPYYGAQGIIDWVDDFLFDGRYILVPEDGENLRSRKLPLAYFADGQFWVNNHAHIIRGRPEVLDDVFLQQWLSSADLSPYITGAAQPKLSQGNMRRIPVPLPPLATQRKIAAVLSAYDDLIENSNRRIRLLEEMAQRIYYEWFVDFRYPGREAIRPVSSALGSIPLGWSVKAISEIASPERYAVTGGPFGSKLGTKDYIDRGVPVIRGTNLAVGGGFRDSDFVFVSEAKADSLPSCLAHRGDILVTQRGTLGQVGLIPPSAQFDRYLLSQSQMKITVDPELGSAQYLYTALRSPEVTARLLGRAMTAGVPHINLSLLRNFQVVWPERALQQRFAHAVHPFGEQVENLTRSVENARVTRDLLLPRLLSGAIDVADLAIEVPEAAA